MGIFGLPDPVVDILDPGGFHQDDDKLAKERAQMAEGLYGSVDQGGQIGRVSGQAEQFGQSGQAQYGQLTNEAQRARLMLQRQALGQDSISAEQLRQGLQQNVAAQQSMAAGASPQNSAMAARTASNNAARLGGGLAGQQSLAGLQERQQAQMALNQAILGARQQDITATLGGQQQALSGYGANEQARTNRYGALLGVGMPTSTGSERFMGAAGGALGAIAASDRRLKKDVRSGDDDADDLLKGLKAVTHRYKNEEHGKGEFVSVMAQDLEKSRAGRAAVINTPKGKMVHGARLALALAAVMPGLDKRLSKLEKRGR